VRSLHTKPFDGELVAFDLKSGLQKMRRCRLSFGDCFLTFFRRPYEK